MLEKNKENLISQFIFFITWKIIRKNKDRALEKIVSQVPNFITADLLVYLRFLLTLLLFLLFLGGTEAIFYWLVIIYSFCKFTDLLDGSLARLRKQTTNYGEIFDPLIDRLLNIVCLVIIITLWSFNSLWFFILINFVSVILLVFDLLLILYDKITLRLKSYRKAFEVVGYLIAVILLLKEIIKK